MKRNIFVRFIISKFGPFLARHPGILVALGLVYLISPFDILPEALTGPLGYFDDLIALILGAALFNKLKDFKSGGDMAPKTDNPGPKRAPHEVLGVSRGASREEVDKAYRKKMSEYHPDKVAHLGEDLRKTADEKTREIRAAYDALTGGK